MQFDIEKDGWELELLDALAGEHLRVKEALDDGYPERPWLASIQTLTFGAVVRGQTRAEARWGLVTIVALDRLERELNKLGWTEVENYIDEAEFVVARDRSGRRWGIGVSDDDAVTRAWILDQIRLEDEIDVAVVLDYRDLVGDGQIQMALAAAAD
jgi:hypothetical protein